MVQFSLDIQFSAQDLGAIGDQQVVVYKDSADSPGNVVWVSMRPMEINTLQWHEKYGLFASTSRIEHGVTIEQMTKMPNAEHPEDFAKSTMQYPFQKDLTFGEGRPALPAGRYGVHNLSGTLMTMGLLVQVTDSSGKTSLNPVTAVSVGDGETVQFEPIQTLRVGLQKAATTGQIVLAAEGSTCSVVYRGSVVCQVIHYSATSNSFLPGPLPGS